MKNFFQPVWFPDRDVSSGALSLLRVPVPVLFKPLDHSVHLREVLSVFSVREYDVESLNTISEKAETPDEHSVASSLDVTSKMDVAADTSRGEHSPLRHIRVVLQSIIRITASFDKYHESFYLFQRETNPHSEDICFLIVLEVFFHVLKGVANVNLDIFPRGGRGP